MAVENSSLKVSIIVPVYNVAPYLRQCLDSLCNQTLKEIELICVDDASSDESPQILKEYAAKDRRMKIITHTENKGLGPARNSGIEAAQGEWLMFVDSDDYVYRQFAEVALHKVQKAGVKLAIFGIDSIQDGQKEESSYLSYPEDQKIDNPWKQYCYGQDYINPSAWNKIYHHTLFSDKEIRYPATYAEDLLVTFAILHSVSDALLLSDQLYVYRKRDGSISRSHSERHILDYFSVFKLMWQFVITRGLAGNADVCKHYRKLLDGQLRDLVKVTVLRANRPASRAYRKLIQKLIKSEYSAIGLKGLESCFPQIYTKRLFIYLKLEELYPLYLN